MNVIYKGIECELYHVRKGAYGHNGEDYWQLGYTARSSIKMKQCEKAGFTYSDRGIYTLRISDKMAMDLQSLKVITFGDYKICLEMPNTDIDLRHSKDNNINCVQNENKIWNIGDLLSDYSVKHNLNYKNDMYFDIIKVDDSHVKCTGFINHCVIDVFKAEIVSIINNR